MRRGRSALIVGGAGALAIGAVAGIHFLTPARPLVPSASSVSGYSAARAEATVDPERHYPHKQAPLWVGKHKYATGVYYLNGVEMHIDPHTLKAEVVK